MIPLPSQAVGPDCKRDAEAMDMGTYSGWPYPNRGTDPSRLFDSPKVG